MGDPDTQRTVGQLDGRLIAVERDIAEIKAGMKTLLSELREIKEQRAQVIGASKVALWLGRIFWLVAGGVVMKYMPGLATFFR